MALKESNGNYYITSTFSTIVIFLCKKYLKKFLDLTFKKFMNLLVSIEKKMNREFISINNKLDEIQSIAIARKPFNEHQKVVTFIEIL